MHDLRIPQASHVVFYTEIFGYLNPFSVTTQLRISGDDRSKMSRKFDFGYDFYAVCVGIRNDLL